MSEYILFSAVGGHDPIANFKDGAVLHICRVYKPQKIYLYISKEMIERSASDNRYVKSIELLAEHLGFKPEVKTIERPDLTEVHLFDSFYQDFEDLINDIVRQNENSTVLLNLSSGTPAMKSALEIISAISPLPTKALQVASPNRKENPKKELPEQFNLEIYWEFNEDNSENFENRITELKSLNLSARIKKEVIASLLKNYDYVGAITVAKEIEQHLSEKTLTLLNIAVLRSRLDFVGISKLSKNNKLTFIPIETSGEKILAEYLINLEIKRRQGNLADFIRGITPLIVDLLVRYLLTAHKIDLKKHCVYKYNTYKISREKLLSTEQGKEILSILEKGYDGNLREGVYTSAQVYRILEVKEKDKTTAENLQRLEAIEKNLRNFVAHEIVSVDESWISDKVQETPVSIIKLLNFFAVKSGVPIKDNHYNSYDEMNEEIILGL